jgi:hypothetical protein
MFFEQLCPELGTEVGHLGTIMLRWPIIGWLLAGKHCGGRPSAWAAARDDRLTSECKTRLLAIALPAADLLGRQAELAGLTPPLRGPGGGPWMCSAMPTREGRAAPRTGEPAATAWS